LILTCAFRPGSAEGPLFHHLSGHRAVSKLHCNSVLEIFSALMQSTGRIRTQRGSSLKRAPHVHMRTEIYPVSLEDLGLKECRAHHHRGIDSSLGDEACLEMIASYVSEYLLSILLLREMRSFSIPRLITRGQIDRHTLLYDPSRFLFYRAAQKTGG